MSGMTIKEDSSERLREQAIDRFWETIPPLWGRIRAHIRGQAVQKFGISVEQFHVLRYVRRGMGSVSDLATAKNISRPAISQAVNTLVEKGLLSRIQSTRDRRCVDLALTPAGNALLDEVFRETRGWMRKRMHGLSDDEFKSIMHAMESLKKMLEETKA
jgi:DNA-binding MarR family transcriptional regulator